MVVTHGDKFFVIDSLELIIKDATNKITYLSQCKGIQSKYFKLVEMRDSDLKDPNRVKQSQTLD